MIDRFQRSVSQNAIHRIIYVTIKRVYAVLDTVGAKMEIALKVRGCFIYYDEILTGYKPIVGVAWFAMEMNKGSSHAKYQFIKNNLPLLKGALARLITKVIACTIVLPFHWPMCKPYISK